MSYQVKLTVHASEVAKKLPPEIKKAAKKALQQLEENPDLGKELQAVLTGFRSYRFMRYRIVYKVVPAAGNLNRTKTAREFPHTFRHSRWRNASWERISIGIR
jgi:mRNA-degrading endonuclease RelE of RelBE toxin-antitoxin system